VIAHLFLLPFAILARQEPPADLAARTRGIFIHKCAECHGPNLAKPRGQFGFITDLPRLAKSPEYIIPGDPDKSDLWNQIASGEMPPRRATNGPLTQEEKDTVLAWVKAGAPSPTGVEAPSTGASTKTSSSSAQRKSLSPRERAIEMLGRLHVVVIHFPIALLALAAMAEVWRRLRPSAQTAPVIRASLALGALSAISAAGLGWIHARDAAEAAYSTLWFHRWLGTIGAGVSLLAWAAHELGRSRARPALLISALILLAATLAGAAGHFGGLITHGSDFYSP